MFWNMLVTESTIVKELLTIIQKELPIFEMLVDFKRYSLTRGVLKHFYRNEHGVKYDRAKIRHQRF